MSNMFFKRLSLFFLLMFVLLSGNKGYGQMPEVTKDEGRTTRKINREGNEGRDGGHNNDQTKKRPRSWVEWITSFFTQSAIFYSTIFSSSSSSSSGSSSNSNSPDKPAESQEETKTERELRLVTRFEKILMISSDKDNCFSYLYSICIQGSFENISLTATETSRLIITYFTMKPISYVGLGSLKKQNVLLRLLLRYGPEASGPIRMLIVHTHVNFLLHGIILNNNNQADENNVIIAVINKIIEKNFQGMDILKTLLCEHTWKINYDDKLLLINDIIKFVYDIAPRTEEENQRKTFVLEYLTQIKQGWQRSAKENKKWCLAVDKNDMIIAVINKIVKKNFQGMDILKTLLREHTWKINYNDKCLLINDIIEFVYDIAPRTEEENQRKTFILEYLTQIEQGWHRFEREHSSLSRAEDRRWQRRFVEEFDRQRLAEERERQRLAEEREQQRRLAEEREQQRRLAEERDERRQRLAKERERQHRLEEEEREQRRLEEERERQRLAKERDERHRRFAEKREQQHRFEEEERERQRLEEEERERQRLAEERERQRRFAKKREQRRLEEEERERQRRFEEDAKNTPEKAAYKVLGVKPDATNQAIGRAYRQKSLQLHPDKNKSEDTTSKFRELNEAYEVIKELRNMA